MDDSDLDSAALWAAVDSAAAQASRARSVAIDDDHRDEMLQPVRPFKSPRLALAASYAATHRRLSPFRIPLGLTRLHTPLPTLLHLPEAGSWSSRARPLSLGVFAWEAPSPPPPPRGASCPPSPWTTSGSWRKISCFFNISSEIKDHSIEFDESGNVNHAEFIVRASRPDGRFSDGWGSCDRREKRFNKPNHDIPSTAETRAKNKACQDLLGIGNNRPGEAKNPNRQQPVSPTHFSSLLQSTRDHGPNSNNQPQWQHRSKARPPPDHQGSAITLDSSSMLAAPPPSLSRTRAAASSLHPSRQMPFLSTVHSPRAVAARCTRGVRRIASVCKVAYSPPVSCIIASSFLLRR
ncbi:hypothetical protein PR202_gb20826 [Eleusine coracana subsp. coracana]|uniref:Uncharacterized protein n=1 Tax=Eleusine coracana subsp. coracana TaxID=191504 RepID=A0AAV5FDJ9_ELECO|nr:hypothetical protein PR202_gb20826 [Eleusine coracana subsp. coracana]